MNTLKLSLLMAFCLGIIGCAAFKNGSPTTKVEQQLFTVTTNQVPVAGTTNFQPVYTYTPGPVVKDVQTGVGLIPGYGTLASLGVGALTTLWAWLRSTKNGATAVTLGQEIETLRELVKSLPNGATYDTALTSWLQQHQGETGTITSVIDLLAQSVSNPDAKVAAQTILDGIRALNPSAVPPK